MTTDNEKSTTEATGRERLSARVSSFARGAVFQLPGDLILVDETLWVLDKPTGLRGYDHDFRRYFPCKHPLYLPEAITTVARIGAFEDYPTLYQNLETEGITLINSPDQHKRADELPAWYDRLEGATPESIWFDGKPDIDAIERTLGWPVFVKGARQTHGHQRRQCIANDRDELTRLLDFYDRDPMLRWQTPVFRRFVRLRPLPSSVTSPPPERVQGSFEIRTFWWKGHLVGEGAYWWQDERYSPSESERIALRSVASAAAAKMDVPFLVIDVGQLESGAWIVIECNDAQESGHAGISPHLLWQNILEIERRTMRLATPAD